MEDRHIYSAGPPIQRFVPRLESLGLAAFG